MRIQKKHSGVGGGGGGGGAGSIPTLWFCACVHLLLNFLDIWTFIAKLAAFKIIAATL